MRSGRLSAVKYSRLVRVLLVSDVSPRRVASRRRRSAAAMLPTRVVVVGGLGARCFTAARRAGAPVGPAVSHIRPRGRAGPRPLRRTDRPPSPPSVVVTRRLRRRTSSSTATGGSLLCTARSRRKIIHHRPCRPRAQSYTFCRRSSPSDAASRRNQIKPAAASAGWREHLTAARRF